MHLVSNVILHSPALIKGAIFINLIIEFFDEILNFLNLKFPLKILNFVNIDFFDERFFWFLKIILSTLILTETR